MSTKFAHVCQDGHQAIGHNDSESELCPLCRVMASESELAALRRAVQANSIRQDVAELRDEVKRTFEANYAILKANQLLLQGIDAVGDATLIELQEEAVKSRELAGERHRIECELIKAGFERLGKEVQFIRGYTLATLQHPLKAISDQLMAIESKLGPQFDQTVQLTTDVRSLTPIERKVVRRAVKSAQSQSNQSLGGKQRRRKKR